MQLSSDARLCEGKGGILSSAWSFRIMYKSHMTKISMHALRDLMISACSTPVKCVISHCSLIGRPYIPQVNIRMLSNLASVLKADS
jgi:hypothetical protein